MANGWAATGCKDCGRQIVHEHPLSYAGKIDFYEKFKNAHITIYWDFATKHHLCVIHGDQERFFMSCGISLEILRSDQEINRILTWAGVSA